MNEYRAIITNTFLVNVKDFLGPTIFFRARFAVFAVSASVGCLGYVNLGRAFSSAECRCSAQKTTFSSFPADLDSFCFHQSSLGSVRHVFIANL